MPVARCVHERAATNGKRVQAQGGAKNHIIVTDSADIAFAAERSISSALACSGERCLANDIALVDRSVHEEYVDHLVRLAGDQVLGDGTASETDVGPLITAEHEERVRELVETGIEEGRIWCTTAGTRRPRRKVVRVRGPTRSRGARSATTSVHASSTASRPT